MTYYVYMMTNKWHTVIYTGVTSDLEGRGFGRIKIKQTQNRSLQGIIAISWFGMLKQMTSILLLKKKRELKQVQGQRKYR